MVKKILIPYATYGNGHKTVANYIKNNFENKNKDLIIETLDILEYASPFMRWLSKTFFEKTMFARVPIIWDLFYKFYNNRIRSLGMKKVCIQVFDKKKLRDKVTSFNPDVIISTHFFGNILMSKYKKQNLINSKLYSIVTDYELHEFWLKEIKSEEAIIVSNKEMKEELIDKGIPKNKIKVFGIPVSDEFASNLDSREYKKKLKVDNGKLTILFFGGGNNSNASLPFFKKIASKEYDFNIIFIAGRNNELKKKVSKIVKEEHLKNIKVLGFVKVNDYLPAADLVVTKPGGLTVTECLFFQKPMLLINHSAGQEKGNYKYLVRQKYALKAGNAHTFNKYLKKIKENPQIVVDMQKNMKGENKKKATNDLYNLIMKN